MVIFVLAAILGAAYLSKNASDALANATAREDAAGPKAQQAVDVANKADTVLTTAQGPLLNLRLAQAMNAHNSVYPAFYDKLLPYIPAYFRLTSLTATPVDANSSTVTMQGTLGSFEQYADVMLAMLRIPGAQSVSRAGYQLQDKFIPPLTRDDQTGRMIEQGKTNLPDDPIERLNTMIANAGETHFTGTGGFGTTDFPKVRGAMPGESLVTIQVVVTQNLLTPNPRATLSSGAFGAAAPANAGGAAPGGGNNG